MSQLDRVTPASITLASGCEIASPGERMHRFCVAEYDYYDAIPSPRSPDVATHLNAYRKMEPFTGGAGPATGAFYASLDDAGKATLRDRARLPA